MKKIKLLGYLFLLSIFVFTSCNSEEGTLEIDQVIQKSFSKENPCGESMSVPLIAGQHIDVGTVTVSNDETNLYVTYETTGNWVVTETHLYVGPENGIPLNGGGNPKIGKFPYHGNGDEPFTIPLANLDDCFVVVAHAVVDKIIDGEAVQSETAFGCGDKEFPGNRWGCYFDYCIEECEEDDCLDVFGRKDGHYECLNIELNEEVLWGWSNTIVKGFIDAKTANGGYAKVRLYANINDNCELSNAIEIGRVEVTSVNGGLNFKYVLNSGYSLDEINLYAGDHGFDSNSDTFYSSNSEDSVFVSWSGDSTTLVFVTAHAKVCQDGD